MLPASASSRCMPAPLTFPTSMTVSPFHALGYGKRTPEFPFPRFCCVGLVCREKVIEEGTRSCGADTSVRDPAHHSQAMFQRICSLQRGQACPRQKPALAHHRSVLGSNLVQHANL